MKSAYTFAQCNQSSLSIRRNVSSLAIQISPNKDSDQTARTQADLNLRWAHMSEGTFSDVLAHMILSVSMYVFHLPYTVLL